MSDSPASGSPCPSASEANAAIRAFLAARSGRPLWPDEREEYERLRAAWTAAVRREVEKAA
ncbi:hypothetical protein [Streptomyces sp. 8N706]|uniref:hypothetical protein n=1 Tax=Streptomyces sp. 8N706 TaxID=3457416 RepID=UPI003FD016F9